MKHFCIGLILIASIPLYAQKTDNQPTNDLHFQDLFSSNNSKEVACYRIPSLITAPNGDLIAAIDQRVPSCGDLKWNKDINIVIRRSNDNGKTWTDIEKVVDYPFGQSASDPSIIVDKETASIFMFYNYMDLVNDKDVYYLQFIKSTDNGKTWSQPTDLTKQITKEDWNKDFKFITSGRGIQTRKGKLMHTMVNLQKGLFVFASDDHGKSWYVMETPIQPADESKIIELNDGSWMINSRVNDAGMRYVHISKDEGKTWQSKPEPELIDPSCNASIIRYSSTKNGDDENLILFSNLNHEKERKNLTIKISYDEGKTWSNGKTIYSGSAAYSSMSILPNGEIGLFFEKDDYSQNVFVAIDLDWLINEQDSLN